MERLPSALLTLALFVLLTFLLIGYLSRSVGTGDVGIRIRRLLVMLFVFLGAFAAVMAVADFVELFRDDDDVYAVSRVVDGDTIDVTRGGET
jgi:hypothetical protein